MANTAPQFVPVQILDGPVPQSPMGGVQDQILQRTAELVTGEVMLVIDVPKISFQDRIPRRASPAVPRWFKVSRRTRFNGVLPRWRSSPFSPRTGFNIVLPRWWRSSSALFGRGRPCVLERQVPAVLVHRRRGTHSVTVQKTDEIPQVLLLDKFDDIRCCSTTGAGSWQCRKLWRFRSCTGSL